MGRPSLKAPSSGSRSTGMSANRRAPKAMPGALGLPGVQPAIPHSGERYGALGQELHPRPPHCGSCPLWGLATGSIQSTTSGQSARTAMRWSIAIGPHSRSMSCGKSCGHARRLNCPDSESPARPPSSGEAAPASRASSSPNTAHPGVCHTRATRQGDSGSVTVTTGNRSRSDQERLRAAQADARHRTSKLVMRVRFPSPALILPGQGIFSARAHVPRSEPDRVSCHIRAPRRSSWTHARGARLLRSSSQRQGFISQTLQDGASLGGEPLMMKVR